MQMLLVAVLTTAALAAGLVASAEAGQRRVKATPAPRDCTPINGRYGYYGNPWCDTRSYRLEDIEYRERTARKRAK
ncbi:MAG TPA: hypothetical protein PLD46_05865 [Hyphomicrobium sp.]|nr:hypothetical protein [Hyphomicrobium sp.]